MPVFDAHLIVDWTARPEGGDAIWLCCVEGGLETLLANPPTRAAAEALLADTLGDMTARGLSVLAGFDCAFGFPRGFAGRLCPRQPDWRGVWKTLAAGGEDRAGAADFAGLPERRFADERLPPTRPAWKPAHAGQIIPVLFRLRHHPWLAAFTRIWPFEPPLDGPGVVMAEVWPAMALAAGHAVKGAAPARALARHFARADREGRLEALLAAPRRLAADQRATVESEEGWVLGLPAPAADWLRDPQAIYAQSFATIRREIDLDALPAGLRGVVTRIVHACGMTDIVEDLRFSPEAVASGRRALAAGAPILADCEMVTHGIIRRRLNGNPVICTLNDPAVAGMATRLGTTRSAAALDLWRPHLDGAVVAIGNAPTALFHLLEMKGARPALVLGFPVGFVGAAESKDALAASDLPHITLLGRRGGSAMAAAAVNALSGGEEA